MGSQQFSEFQGGCTTATFALTSTTPATLVSAVTGVSWVPLSGLITTNATTAVLLKDGAGVGLLSPSSAGLQLSAGVQIPHNPHGSGVPGTVSQAVTIESSNGSATVTGYVTFIGVKMTQPSA